MQPATPSAGNQADYPSLSHFDHHLYQVLWQICTQLGKCTCSRETLAKMIGASPASKRRVTEAIEKFEALGMLLVERGAHRSSTITIDMVQERSEYDSEQWEYIQGTISTNALERELGIGADVEQSASATKSKRHEEISRTLEEEDFDL